MNTSEEQPLVSIYCTVYNHEPYVRKCLEGFVMQKTDFKFEAIVHDDASTDGSAAIIMEFAKRYPDIIKPIIEKENQWSKHDGSLNRVMYGACKGKYIAYCEGDDYWIDPYKLQKEVNAINGHHDATLVHTNFVSVNQNGLPIPHFHEDFPKRSKNGNVLANLFKGNYIMTLTTLIDRRVLDSDIYKGLTKTLDYGLFLSAASLGDVVYLNDKTGCYRVTDTGFMRSRRKEVNDDLYDILKYYGKLFKEGKLREVSFFDSAYIRLKTLANAYSHEDYKYIKYFTRHDIFNKLCNFVIKIYESFKR